MHAHTHANKQEARTCVWLGWSSQKNLGVCVCACMLVRISRASRVCMSEYVEQSVPDAGHTHTHAKQHWCRSALVWIFNKPQSICSIIHEAGHRIVSKYKHRCFSPAFATSLHLWPSHALFFTFLFCLSLFFFPVLPPLFLSSSLSLSLAPLVLRLWIFQMAEWFLNYPLLASALLTWFGLHFSLTHGPTRKENSDKP